jgi:hypothetical protein
VRARVAAPCADLVRALGRRFSNVRGDPVAGVSHEDLGADGEEVVDARPGVGGTRRLGNGARHRHYSGRVRILSTLLLIAAVIR